MTDLPAEATDPRYTPTLVEVADGPRPAWRSQRAFEPGIRQVSGTFWAKRDILDRPDWRRYVAAAEAALSRSRGWLVGEAPQVDEPDWTRQRDDGYVPVRITMLVTVQS